MIQSAKCLLRIFLLISLQCYFCIGIVAAQTPKDTLILKEQISKLQDDLEEQKTLTSSLLEKLNDLINNQNQIIIQFNDTSKLIKNIPTLTTGSTQGSFKDAFILNKDGKPIAFADDMLKLYEYFGGNLIGYIKPDTNEIVRNFDDSVIAQIENDFVLDETGHAIGSVERSENLRWDREKLYSQVQKEPVSHYFVKVESPRLFNLSTFRYSDWSTQKLEDVLFFSEKKIQKLK